MTFLTWFGMFVGSFVALVALSYALVYIFNNLIKERVSSPTYGFLFILAVISLIPGINIALVGFLVFVVIGLLVFVGVVKLIEQPFFRTKVGEDWRNKNGS